MSMVPDMSVPAPLRVAALAFIALSSTSPVMLAATPAPPAPQKPTHQVQQKESPQGVTRLGGAQGWEAYSDSEKGEKICYLMGEPTKSEPAGAKRSKVFASITHRPADKVSNEVSFNAGYTLKEGSEVELVIDGHKFSLFTNKDGAWGRDAKTDKDVVDALVKGKQAIVKGTSARGTDTTDTYSLVGLSQALAAIDKACGVKR